MYISLFVFNIRSFLLHIFHLYSIFYHLYFIISLLFYFYAPEGTSGGILKSNRPPSVRPSVRPLQIVSQRYLINYWSKFNETSQKDKK